jgi:hypothetical protein
MSVKTAQSPFAAIASSALDQINCDLEHARWLSALMRAIQTDAKHRNGRDTAELAAIGQYLADDMLSVVEDAASHLKSELNAVEDAA